MTEHPHGTPERYRRHCGCDACTRAITRYNKRRRIAVATGTRRRRWAPPEREEAARAHLRAIRATQGLSFTAIGRATTPPTSGNHLSDIADGRARPSWKVADAILALEVGAVIDPSPTSVDVTDLAWYVRTMQALGYSLAWQSRQVSTALRRNVNLHDFLGRPAIRSTDLVAAVVELAATVGDREATPDRDLTSSAITYSKRLAAAKGYYPPIYYDDDRRLIWQAVPTHPWARDDRIATARVAAVAALLAGTPVAEAAAAAGLSVRRTEEAFTRLSKHWGWRSSWPVRRRVEAIIAAWRSGEASSTTTALDLRILEPTFAHHTNPDALAWLVTPQGRQWQADHRPEADQGDADATEQAAA